MTWIAGIVILSLSKLVNYHFFYLYYYFFGVGTVSLGYSLLKYAKIEENSITIYFGIFFKRKSLRIPWSQFDTIKQSSFNKSHMRTFGGRVRVPAKITETKEAILFKLKEPLSLLNKNEGIKNNKKYLDEIEINNKRDEILLKTAPEGGFRRLLLEMNNYFPTTIENDFDESAYSLIHTLITILNLAIVLIVFFLGVMI